MLYELKARETINDAHHCPRICFTPREWQVLLRMVEGWTDEHIALELSITVYTVRKFVGNILAKTESQSRTEAAVKVIRWGLIE